jgi:hypothetical protein
VLARARSGRAESDLGSYSPHFTETPTSGNAVATLLRLMGLRSEAGWVRAKGRRSRILFGIALLLGAPVRDLADADPSASTAVALDVHAFRPVEGPSSGPEVYYSVLEMPDGPLLRGSYRPGMQSVTMGIRVPDHLVHRARLLRWSWRARAFPDHGDECREGRGDSAASVSVAFKRGLRWYVLKYVWSSVSRLGAVCDRKRTLLLARDTIVLESGGAPGTVRREVVDVRRAFIDHFAGGDPHAEVPDLVGIGVMTDGDQTRSESGAEWMGFELQR